MEKFNFIASWLDGKQDGSSDQMEAIKDGKMADDTSVAQFLPAISYYF